MISNKFDSKVLIDSDGPTILDLDNRLLTTPADCEHIFSKGDDSVNGPVIIDWNNAHYIWPNTF